jgi:acyl-CoA synthetase (NDP forming)
MEELTEVLACCQGARWPAGPRVGVLTGSGGQAELILDVASELDLDLPGLSKASKARAAEVIGPISGDGNPLDAWGSGDFRTNFPHAFSVLDGDGGYDAVVMYSDTNDGQPMAPTQYIPFLAEASTASDLPHYYMTTRHGLFREEFVETLRDADAAILTGVRSGMLAIDRLAKWAMRTPAERPESDAMREAAALLAETNPDTRSLNEYDAKRILFAGGLPVVDEAEVATPDELAAAAARIGYPVVVKVVSDEIPHKTEHGLVEVGIANEEFLRAAHERIAERLGRLPARPDDARLVVQKMVTGGVEVFAGISRDPDFGLTLAFGLGGTLIEIVDDVALRPLPLRDGDAEAMIDETLAGRVLRGVRGRPPGDIDAVAAALYRLADFAWAGRDAIDEVDLNPIMVLPEGQGCVIVDALIVRAAGPESD